MLWVGEEVVGTAHAGNSKDASDLCDEGHLQAVVKQRQHLLHHLKACSVFPLALGVSAVTWLLIQMGFVFEAHLIFQTLSEISHDEDGFLA